MRAYLPNSVGVRAVVCYVCVLRGGVVYAFVLHWAACRSTPPVNRGSYAELKFLALNSCSLHETI